MTERQLVGLGIHLIKNFNDFERGLDDWYAQPLHQKTWANFKTHFEAAYRLLRQRRGPSMKNTVFQQTANSITEKVMTELQADKEQVFNHTNQSEQKILSALKNTCASSSSSPSTTNNQFHL